MPQDRPETQNSNDNDGTTPVTQPPPTTAAPTGAYCSAFESLGRTNSRGEQVEKVVLHRANGSTVSYQGRQSWVESRCQQALGQ
ncbi:hypothetical protein [Candidatus Poriferisodalis sp.]|uniref:hypothetical protein n=1 Tax=Candidatus Poriferisodalis sp. TaxID=3101277 RepID=UPI003B5B7F39